MTTLNTSSIDSLLDGTLDDLADVPEFKPFPVGAHRATIKWEVKAVNEKPVVELTITAIESVELADPEGVPVKAGDQTSVMFMFTKKDGTPNELAQGQWKELLAPLASHFATTSNRATMEASNGAECLVVTGIRQDKRDTADVKNYTKITSLTVL